MYLFFINLAVILGLAIAFPEEANGLEKGGRRSRYLLFALGYLTLLAILRSPAVGTDTARYCRIFEKVGKQKSALYYMLHSSTEKGFLVYCLLLYRICPGEQFFLMVTGLFLMGTMYWFFGKYSRIPWLSVFLFFTLMLFDFFLSGMRQAMAICILLYAYDRMLERKPVAFCVLVVTAALFHTSAIVFLAAYPISMLRSTKKFMLISGAVALAAAVLWQVLLPVVLKLFPKYDYYTGDEEFSSGGILAVTMKGLVYLTALGAGELLWNRKNRKMRTLGEEMELRLVWVLPLIAAVALGSTVVSRFFRYFEPFLCLYLPNVLRSQKTRKGRTCITILLVAAFTIYASVIQILRTPQWQSTYPFTFFWTAP